MNKILTCLFCVLLIVFFTFGCKELEPEPEKPLAENQLFRPSKNSPYRDVPFNRICEIVTIKDGRGNTHEYLDYWVGSGNGGGSICHYPDCKYCLEKNNVKH